MRTIKFIALAIAASAALVACKSEPWIYNSATLDYAGRFVMYDLNGDGADLSGYLGGEELRIYNTAADVATEIWLDDAQHFFPFKAKLSISGSPSNFASTAPGVNIIAISENVPGTVLGAGVRDTVLAMSGKYACPVEVSIASAQIVKGGAQSIGGNTADALNIELKLSYGYIVYESVVKARNLWADSTVAEYGWEYRAAIPVHSNDETYTIKAYRYTGMPEDKW